MAKHDDSNRQRGGGLTVILRHLTDRVSVIPAGQTPLSADIGIIRGDTRTFLYDVGADKANLPYLASLPNKHIVLSHFHADHITCVSAFSDAPLYVTHQTLRYTHRGQEITKPTIIDDGVRLTIQPIPASHAKGSLMLLIDDDLAFLGDALYPATKGGRAVYNTQLLLEQIRLLQRLTVPTLLLSHDAVFAHDREEVVCRLQGILARRAGKEVYILA